MPNKKSYSYITSYILEQKFSMLPQLLIISILNGKVKDNKLLIWFNTGPVSIHTTLGCLHCNITVALFMIFFKKYPCTFLFRTVFKLYAKSRSWIIYHCLLRSFSSFENIFFNYPNNEACVVLSLIKGTKFVTNKCESTLWTVCFGKTPWLQNCISH